MEETQQLARRIKDANKTPQREDQEVVTYIPTGSSLLNLALSDKADGGYGVGKMVNLIGDSSSGKTLLGLTMFAEANRLKRFKNYRFIYDDVEAALEFDLEYLFGSKVQERIEAPAQDDEGNPVYSKTIQDFKKHIFKMASQGTPFIYVLDSFDALSSDEEMDKIEAQAKGKTDTAGSYKTEKAKIIGETLRIIVDLLKKTGSLLIIISQTRDNLTPMVFNKKTRSGGHALRFYATHEIWLAVLDKIKSKDRIIGAHIKAKVTKNKLTGKIREVEFPVFYDYGVDDIGSILDFLIAENLVESKKQTITIPGMNLTGTKSKLIKEIEDGRLEKALQTEVGKAWKDIEDSLKLGRRPRYAEELSE